MRSPSRGGWERPLSSLALSLCLVLAMLMLYLPFQFQSQALRYLYPYLRLFGVGYGLVALLLLLDAVRVGLPSTVGRAGRLLFSALFAAQAYLAAYRTGVIPGQFLYTAVVIAVLLSDLLPRLEGFLFPTLYAVLSLCFGTLLLTRRDLYPANVFGTLPLGLGPLFMAGGLLQVVAPFVSLRRWLPAWAPLLLVAVPFFWFSYYWMRVNNWVGISIYLTIGGVAVLRALYLAFPWRIRLTGLRLRILVAGVLLAVIPLTTLGAISVYMAQVLDAREANQALEAAALSAELSVAQLFAANPVTRQDLAQIAAHAAHTGTPYEVTISLRPLEASVAATGAGERLVTREEFLEDGQRILTTTIARPDWGIAIVAAQGARRAYDQANQLALIALLVTALVAGLGVVVSRALAVHLTTPLAEVRDVALGIGNQQYHLRAQVIGDDEVADLGHTINTVAQKLGDYSQRIDRLIAISDTALAHLSLSELTAELVERIREALHGDTAVILLLTADGRHLVPVGGMGPLSPDFDRIRVPVGEGFSGRVAQERQALIVENLDGYPIYRKSFMSQLHAVVGAPLLVADRLIGVIHVGSFTQRTFTAEEADLLQMAADRIALAIEHARLYADLERRVTERTLELVTANRELEAFAYSVSHDLRSPLRSINGFSQILMEDYGDKLDATATNYLERICAATLKMDRLITAMLGLSRVTRADLVPQTVDLSALARQLADDLQRQEPERQVEVVVAPGLRVVADPALLRIALENLLANAFKFSRPVPTPRIEVGAEEQQGERVFLVRDNGIGFDTAYAGQLFQPFQRLHTAAEFEGTGIGLATVQRIVQRHGGRIWGESGPGKGAAFYFTLPGNAEKDGKSQ